MEITDLSAAALELRRQGVSLDDVVRVLAAAVAATGPTVREAVLEIEPTLPAKSQRAYAASLRRLLDGEPDLEVAGELVVPGFPGLADQPFGAVTLADLELRRDRIRALEGRRQAQEGRARGSGSGFLDPDAAGFGASSTWVDACHAVFRRAIRSRICSFNAADGLRKLPHQPFVYALSDAQLNETRLIIALTSLDPVLDTLLLDYLVWTAWRRIAIFNQTRNLVDADRPAIGTSQKRGKPHLLPAPSALTVRLLTLADDRGAVGPLDSVFVTKRGAPVTRRYVQRMFHRVSAQAPWAAALPRFGPNNIRHAVLTHISKAAGLIAAQEWAGHSPTGLGTTGTYLKRYEFADLIQVAEMTWGRPLEEIRLDDPRGYRFATQMR